VGRYGRVNALDLLLIVLLALSGVAGYRRGFTLQAFGFGGLLVGLVVGALLAPFVAHNVEGPNARAGLAVLVLLVVAALGNAAGWFVGVHARDRAASRFRKADSVAGSAVGICITCASCAT